MWLKPTLNCLNLLFVLLLVWVYLNKFIFHPQQAPNSAAMYRQNPASWREMTFFCEVVNSVHHLACVDRVYQYPGISNKCFNEFY